MGSLSYLKVPNFMTGTEMDLIYLSASQCMRQCMRSHVHGWHMVLKEDQFGRHFRHAAGNRNSLGKLSVARFALNYERMWKIGLRMTVAMLNLSS